MKLYSTYLKNIVVSECGKAFDITKQIDVTITNKGYIWHEGKFINFAKLMLYTFENIGIRPGLIMFKDGDRKNFHIKNLRYLVPKQSFSNPNTNALLSIYRYHFGLKAEMNFNDNFDFRSKFATILKINDFFENYKNDPGISVLRDYFDFPYPNKRDIAKKHGITHRATKEHCNRLLNSFIIDCFREGKFSKKI